MTIVEPAPPFSLIPPETLHLPRPARVRHEHRRPNVLLLVMDTQRAVNLGCYGYPRPTSPNLDALAAEGAVFRRNVSAGCWTLPSHASVFTGHYPGTHGADMHHEYLELEFPTLAEELSVAGYLTAGLTSNDWCGTVSGCHRGFRDFIQGLPGVRPPAAYGDQGAFQRYYAFASWLEAHYDGGRPFFAFVNCTEPHLRYAPPEPFRGRFLPEGATIEDALAVDQNPYAEYFGELKRTPQEWRLLKALYDAETALLDDRIGRLVGYLREKGILDETLIAVVGDHGDEQGEHPPHMGHIMNLYDTLLRVPLVVRYPAVIPRGAVVEHLTQSHDLFPTILELLGLDQVAARLQLPGVSLLRALRGEGARAWALAEHAIPLQSIERMLRQRPEFDSRPYFRTLKAYYEDQWKLIWSSDGHDELYRLSDDPDEQTNLAGREREVAGRLKRQLQKVLLGRQEAGLQRDYGDAPSLLPGKAVSERAARVMRAWGTWRPTDTSRSHLRFRNG